MGQDGIVESGIRPDLAIGHDPCYAPGALETTDVRAILVGFALLAIGFVIGRKARVSDPDTLKQKLDEMHRSGEALRDRVTRAEEQSARNDRSFRVLLALLPNDFRDRLTRERDDG